jgi:hypothetical protein
MGRARLFVFKYKIELNSVGSSWVFLVNRMKRRLQLIDLKENAKLRIRSRYASVEY